MIDKDEVLKAIERQEITVKNKNTEEDHLIEKPELDTPEYLEGGLKIWCRLGDKHRVLEIISKNSTIEGILSPEAMFETEGIAHIDFDLTQIYAGKYRLSSKRFDLDASLQELKAVDIPHKVDTASGKPTWATRDTTEELYPINRDDVILMPEKPEIEKPERLAEFARKIKLRQR